MDQPQGPGPRLGGGQGPAQVKLWSNSGQTLVKLVFAYSPTRISRHLALFWEEADKDAATVNVRTQAKEAVAVVVIWEEADKDAATVNVRTQAIEAVAVVVVWEVEKDAAQVAAVLVVAAVVVVAAAAAAAAAVVAVVALFVVTLCCYSSHNYNIIIIIIIIITSLIIITRNRAHVSAAEEGTGKGVAFND